MSGLVQPSEHPGIVYELKAGIEGTFRGKPMKTNSLGMRDAEIETAKPAGTFRIAGLGDSVMFGWGVGQGEAYLDVLENELNNRFAPDRKAETLNFGVPGYNTAMEVAVYEKKALPLQPDMVIIQFINNDWGVPLFMERPKNPASLKESYLLDFLSARMGRFRAQSSFFVHNNMKTLDDQERKSVSEKYAYMVGPTGYRTAMAKLAELTGNGKVPVIVIRGSSHNYQKPVVEEVVAKHGFHLLDIKPYSDAFVEREGIENTPTARKKALHVSKSDHHPNARAHTIYVEAILDQMSKIGLL